VPALRDSHKMSWHMTTTSRRWWLVAHIVCSVGWIGVELTILALGVIGRASSEPVVVRSCYVMAGIIGEVFYFPAAALSLVIPGWCSASARSGVSSATAG
jgi:hypothetical protein